MLNSGFSDFTFPNDTNIFPDNNLRLYFTKYNSIETPIIDVDHPGYVDSKNYINDFRKLTIKKFTLAALQLNIASLSKHFDDLYNLLALLNRSFDIHCTKKMKFSIKDFFSKW